MWKVFSHNKKFKVERLSHLTESKIKSYPNKIYVWLVIGRYLSIDDELALIVKITCLSIDNKYKKKWLLLGFLCLHREDIEMEAHLLVEARFIVEFSYLLPCVHIG